MRINEELYRVESKTFVAGVIVSNSIIIKTAPILKKFIGQPMGNLEKWINKNNMTIERL